jgi:hypothetical protein
VILELSDESMTRLPITIEIDDTPLPDGRVQISIDSMPTCEGTGDTVAVTREEAARIVYHLAVVFRFEMTIATDTGISEDIPLNQALNLASLWRSGKMIGGDAVGVSVALLNALEASARP